MKTLVYLFVIAMLLFAGCAKDEMFTDDSASNLKSASVKMVPLKTDFYSITTAVDEYMLPAEGYLVGTFPHLGKLISEKSTWKSTTTGVVFNEDATGYLSSTSHVEGQDVAANGDILYYYFDSSFDYVNNVFTADPVKYNGGTGRFENCTGEGLCTGYIDYETGLFMLHVDAMLTNVGSSK